MTRGERRLIPVTKWPEYYPWPTVGGLRHLIFHAHETGADTWIRRVGRRVLVDETAFLEWVDARKAHGIAKAVES